MRKFFATMLTVLAVLVIAAPALAQRRGRSERQSRSVRPRQPYQQRYRSYYRGYYGGSGYYGDYGYGYGNRHIWRVYRTGIKFRLDLVAKDDREFVRRGIVSIDGGEHEIVNSHDGWWNGVLPLPPGEHEITVELEDGRVFETQVDLMPSQTIRIYLRFPKPNQ